MIISIGGLVLGLRVADEPGRVHATIFKRKGSARFARNGALSFGLAPTLEEELRIPELRGWEVSRASGGPVIGAQPVGGEGLRAKKNKLT